jgi:LysR family glycine cleavage system transcriptional activator
MQSAWPEGRGPPMLRADRNRGRHVGAKHGSFAQAQENLLQGRGLSVSDCNTMTYSLPPLNAVRAFEAAARHLSFKLAAHELHVTPAAVGQQVKALEARLGVRLFDRLHKQLILTAAGQAYLPGISDGFRRIAEATSQLKPAGAVLLQVGVHGSYDLRRLELAAFRSTHAEIGLRVLQPAGLHELVEGKVDVLIARGLGHHPGYRCDRLNEGPGPGDWLMAPEGTADCPEVVSLREWLRALPAEKALAERRRPRLVGTVGS